MIYSTRISTRSLVVYLHVYNSMFQVAPEPEIPTSHLHASPRPVVSIAAASLNYRRNQYRQHIVYSNMAPKDKYVYFEPPPTFVKATVDLPRLYWFLFCFWRTLRLSRLRCAGYIMNESTENVIFFFVL